MTKPTKHICIDVETRSLPPGTLREIMPAFKPATNLRDPDKIKQDVLDKEQSWLADAALHAVRGEIVCAGLLTNNVIEVVEGPEKDIVGRLMDEVLHNWGNNVIVGHNIFQFDLPFICRRAMKHGIAIPQFLTKALRGYYPPFEIFDTMLEWRLSNRDERISLDMLSWHLGTGLRKTGSGADFARLWVEEKAKAISYLANDLQMVKACYERMSL